MLQHLVKLTVALGTGMTLFGCDESTANVDARCEIEVVPPEASWQRGETVSVQAYPLSEPFDTTVFINDSSIDIIEIDSSQCSECSDCRESALCTTCGFCEVCATECLDCVDELTFTVPASLPSAPDYLLSIVNGYGTSSPISIDIVDENSAE